MLPAMLSPASLGAFSGLAAFSGGVAPPQRPAMQPAAALRSPVPPARATGAVTGGGATPQAAPPATAPPASGNSAPAPTRLLPRGSLLDLSV
jgi:hypothetical protein